MPSFEYIEREDLRRRPMRVAVSPLASLFMATRDAAGAQRSGTPDSWCREIRMYLRPRDYEVLAPLVIAERALVPRAILPLPDAPGQPLTEALERIVASEEQLARDINDCLIAGRTGDWRPAAREPQRWMRGFVVAMARAWNGFRPIWEASQDAIARETERVGVASARESQLEFLDGLLPNARVEKDRWLIESFGATDVRVGLPDGGLVVVPLVAGERASVLNHDETTMFHVGYPLRRLPPRPPGIVGVEGSLEALLGIPRARILRELERPSDHHGIAQALQSVPSTATHHVSALEAAGLVERDRAGRQVLVRRTARGEALLALYEAA